MAKQFSATVQDQSVSFPSSLVRIVGLTDGSNIEYLGATYSADESATDLIDAANTSGTEQVLATILRVNDAVQTYPIVMGFPASLINIYYSSLSGSQSVIVYNNVFYYAEESQSNLEDAANTGGGGGVTIYTGDGVISGDRFVDINNHGFGIGTQDGLGLNISRNIDNNNEQIQIQSFNTTGDTNYSKFLNGTTDLQSDAYVIVDYQDSTHHAELHLYADASGTEFESSADVNSFVHDVVIESLAGGGTTGLSIDNDGKIIRTP